MPNSLNCWLPLLGLAAFGALALWLLRPPRPLPATAPMAAFAAARCRADLDSLAAAPHAIGTAAHARVRAYLLRRFRALGLHPRVQDTTVLLPAARGGPLVLAHVRNIVARQPGTQPGGREVLVLAHYDSQPHTPGAGDDAAGVAAVLEAIRALRAGPPLARDVEWLLTDGEEAGLLGARAYALDTARLRRRVGVAFNFEGRGNQGPSLTFEVSSANGWLVREYARANLAAPLVSSLFYEAYRRLPNDTDFTPLRAAGVAGLNFAFVGGLPYYHSPADTPAHLDMASVQHHGSYLLGLVRHFGSLPLTATRAPDVAFFSLPGGIVVRYPPGWHWAGLALAAAVWLLAAGVATSRRWLTWGTLLLGALAWVGGAVLAVGAGLGLLAAVRAAYPAYAVFYAGTYYNALAYQVALLALGAAVLSGYYQWLMRRLPPMALGGGALVAVGLLAAALASAAPTAAYLLVWPLLAAALAWALKLLAATSRVPAGAAGALVWGLALVAVGLLVPITYLLLTVFGLGTPVLAAVVLLAVLWGLLLSALLPMPRTGAAGAQAMTRRLGSSATRHLPGCSHLARPLLALAGMTAALGWGHLTRQPTPDQPQQTHLYYYLNASTNHAYWVSALPYPDAWVRQVLTRPQHALLPGAPASALPLWWQPAPRLPVAFAGLTVLADTLRGGNRYLRLRLPPGPPGTTTQVLRLPATTPLLALRLQGQTVPAAALPTLAEAGVRLVAPAPGGVLLEAELPVGMPLSLRLLSSTLGLPPGAPALPPTLVPVPGASSFTTQLSQKFSF